MRKANDPSTRAGRPVLVDGVLSVLQVYEVESDVDFSTGNIDSMVV